MGCYGNDWIKTPNLDAFAAESLTLNDAYSEALATLPVRRGIMTGKRVFPFKDWIGRAVLGDFIAAPGWQPLADDDITLSEMFFESGYRTGFITDVYHYFKPSMNFHRGYGEFRFIRGQEMDLWDGSRPDVDTKKFVTPQMEGSQAAGQCRQYVVNIQGRQGEEDYFAPKVFSEGMDYLERNQDAENIFLHLDVYDPHEPWDPPKKYWSLYEDPDYDGVQVINPPYNNPLDYMSREELKHIRALYAGEVTMVDTWFGKFMDKVKQLGMDKNSMIVVIADHGLPLGEHDIIRKNPIGMYPELMDIPYMFRMPDGQRSGERLDGFFYNHDLFVTLLNAAGIPIEHEHEGIDILAQKKGRDYATSAFKSVVWCRTYDHVLISMMDGTDQKLFDLKEDPGQFNNIAKDNPEKVKELFDLILKDAGGSFPDLGGAKGRLSAPRFSTALSVARK